MDRLLKRKTVGELIRYELKISGKSLSALAETYGSTRQNFSKIIRYEAEINPHMINYILENTSGVSFDFDESIYEQAKTVFYNLFMAYYYMDKLQVQKYANALKQDYFYSYGLPYYLLGKAFEAALSYDGETLHHYVSLFSEMQNCIPDDEKDFMHYLQASDLELNGKPNEAFTILENAHYNHLELVSLKEELLSDICCDLRKPLNGMEHLSNAMRLYQRDNSYLRAIAMKNNKGIFYSQLNDYEQAINTWNEAIIEASRYDQPHTIITCTFNICFAYYEKGDYRKAVKFPPELLKGKFRTIQIIALFFSNYHLGNHIECRHLKNLIRQCRGEEELLIMLESLLDHYLRGSDVSDKAKVLNQIIEYLTRDGKKMNITWALRLLAEEYRKSKDYEKLSHVQDELLKLFDFTIDEES